jgi:L,D-peptidoglycan transpeptidase YkuD (ErfK/YbiS/YcfS/YnhG family)
MKDSVIMKRSLFLTAALVAILSCPCLMGETSSVPENILKKKYLSLLAERFPESRQVLLVIPATDGKAPAKIHTFEKSGGKWKSVFSPIDSTLGLRGIADEKAKTEGDRKTPAGIFSLGFAFGYSQGCDTGLEYRPMTDRDVWIDDVSSPDYNRCVSYDPGRFSHEKMKRRDRLYKYGIVINYNMNPVVKGKGSAIFLHVWKDRSTGTAGCVAMPEESIIRLLKWLDKNRTPVIIIGK